VSNLRDEAANWKQGTMNRIIDAGKIIIFSLAEIASADLTELELYCIQSASQ